MDGEDAGEKSGGTLSTMICRVLACPVRVTSS